VIADKSLRPLRAPGSAPTVESAFTAAVHEGGRRKAVPSVPGKGWQSVEGRKELTVREAGTTSVRLRQVAPADWVQALRDRQSRRHGEAIGSRPVPGGATPPRWRSLVRSRGLPPPPARSSRRRRRRPVRENGEGK